jgi:hypothetical protein
MAEIFYLKELDTYPAIEVQLKSNGVPVNLFNCEVTFRMSPTGTGNQMIEDAGYVKYPTADEQNPDLNPTKAGVVGYLWAIDQTQTDEIGTHNVEWTVVFSNGRETTFPRGSNTAELYNQVIIQSRVK